MSAELIGILGVGAALGGLILTLGGWLRGDIRDLRGDIRELRQETQVLGGRVARLEGLFESPGLSRPVESVEPAAGD